MDQQPGRVAAGSQNVGRSRERGTSGMEVEEASSVFHGACVLTIVPPPPRPGSANEAPARVRPSYVFSAEGTGQGAAEGNAEVKPNLSE
ncbi:hypothetical protein AAFF_G00213990 [Aldrovandia affinis]|uniref:Uncharacterized protein n=1 Tax=Aldrovandia affinis TaxID=143900 RepID=A0AAD7RGL0_9TELE|nr:hypothetical protein AAFF_G00213990 [Aldrovandia affinis]